MNQASIHELINPSLIQAGRTISGEVGILSAFLDRRQKRDAPKPKSDRRHPQPDEIKGWSPGTYYIVSGEFSISNDNARNFNANQIIASGSIEGEYHDLYLIEPPSCIEFENGRQRWRFLSVCQASGFLKSISGQKPKDKPREKIEIELPYQLGQPQFGSSETPFMRPIDRLILQQAKTFRADSTALKTLPNNLKHVNPGELILVRAQAVLPTHLLEHRDPHLIGKLDSVLLALSVISYEQIKPLGDSSVIEFVAGTTDRLSINAPGGMLSAQQRRDAINPFARTHTKLEIPNLEDDSSETTWPNQPNSQQRSNQQRDQADA